MPIRVWTETIEIECSDQELPRAIAACHGNYRASEVTYDRSGETQMFLLPNRQTVPSYSRNREYERD